MIISIIERQMITDLKQLESMIDGIPQAVVESHRRRYLARHPPVVAVRTEAERHATAPMPDGCADVWISTTTPRLHESLLRAIGLMSTPVKIIDDRIARA